MWQRWRWRTDCTAEFLFLIIKRRERQGDKMRGVDEGNEWRTTYLEKREKEVGGREKDRDDDRANVPASVHAAPRRVKAYHC